jgi:hypothetical protein
LKTHPVFKSERINKIFPKIGLHNFKEKCRIVNSAEAMNAALRLGNEIRYQLESIFGQLRNRIDVMVVKPDKDNALCAKMQATYNLVYNVWYSINYGDYAKVIDDKVVLKLRSDIFHTDATPVFKKDESLIKVVNKLIEQVDTIPDIKYTKIDQLPAFKTFSSANTPVKDYTVVFSSTGEEGAWDIGTISMRGITSCQSWSAPQSRGLIGSISSRFVGVIYLASDQDIPPYGSKMLYRCVVRMIVNTTSKQPILFLDNMYQQFNQEVVVAFRKVLEAKSGLKVHQSQERAIEACYHNIFDEPSRKHLKQGEFAYMDTQFNVSIPQKLIKKQQETVLTSFKNGIINKVNDRITLKRQEFGTEAKRIEDLRVKYNSEKKAWDDQKLEGPFHMEKPKMDRELYNFGKSGIINLFIHCDKKHGQNSAGLCFTKHIFEGANEVCSSKSLKEFLMSFLKNQNLIKENAWRKASTGTWMKSFPRSSERFFNYVFSQVKAHLMSACKEEFRK